MYTFSGSASTFSHAELRELYIYRHAVFVERLGWDLPGAKNGLEIDQFDRSDTIHVTARNDDGALCGCARLLPTSSPYLLGEVFPELMTGAPPPKSSAIWELSRFSSVVLGSKLCSSTPLWIGQELMAATIKCAIGVGATRLIAVTSKEVERFLRRLGINWCRIGPSQQIGGHIIFAFWIELDEKTLTALDLCDLLVEA
jgi:acyl homoserine lactone synthase